MRKEDLVEQLETMEKPEVHLDHHKYRLKHLLRTRLYARNNSDFQLKKQWGAITMSILKNTKVIAPVLSVALLFGIYSLFFTGSQEAAAYVTLQVNPAVQLVVDKDNEVMQIEPLNDDAKQVVGELELIGMELEIALEMITTATLELGYVDADKEFVLSIRNVESLTNDELLQQLARGSKQAVSDSLSAANQTNEVHSVIVTPELFELALEKGLLPSDYIDLMETGISPEAVQEILMLSDIDGVDKNVFLDELDTVASALEDMLEAGFDEAKAIAMLQGAVKADKDFEELSTIIAAMIDMQDSGANPEQSLAYIQAALEQGVDQDMLLEEITTLTAAHIDMIEEGVSEETASALMKAAMKADPSLEEVTTITSILIDLMEEGLTEQEALAKLLAAMQADPTLENLDDLLEGEQEAKEEEDEAKEEEASSEGAETAPSDDASRDDEDLEDDEDNDDDNRSSQLSTSLSLSNKSEAASNNDKDEQLKDELTEKEDETEKTDPSSAKQANDQEANRESDDDANADDEEADVEEDEDNE